ncbi:hypothetical protein TrVGV298_007049 [Trichoderma virens]|nr:hypothetical protein TrVGV298_007049 [Trichoderma virens]UKZ72425.1 hypothetical protein TrVFT333_000054 [Trichoderma virens FT-333]
MGKILQSHLILIQEWVNSRFSLQPAHGKPLTDFNRALGEFYSKHATKMRVRKWIESNPCQKDLEGEAEKKWMKRWMEIRNIRQGR